jgi:hypothetical protein
MKAFNDIETIWKQQKEKVVPDVTVIIEKANQEKKAMAKKIILQVILLLITVPVVVWVLATNPFKERTTFLGVAMLLIDIIGFAGLRLYQVRWLSKIDFTEAPKLVLEQLEKYYSFEKVVNSKIMAAYFILLNVGLGLYFIEVMKPMPTYAIILSLSVYVGWIAFAFFVIGKKQKAKEYNRIDQLINKMKTIEAGYES